MQALNSAGLPMVLPLALLHLPLQAEQADQALPFKIDRTSDLPGVQDWAVALLGCVLLLMLLVWVLRRWGTGGMRQALPGQKRATVLERTPLGATGQQLVVVRYGDRQLLLLLGPGQATCVRDDPVEPVKDDGAASVNGDAQVPAA